MEDYIARSDKDRKLYLILGAGLGIASAVIFLAGKILIPVLLILAAGSLIYAALTSKAEDGKGLQALKAKGFYEAAAADFPNALAYLDDKFRMSDAYLYRWKEVDIIPLSWITKADYVKTSGGTAEDPSTVHKILLTLQDGRVIELYSTTTTNFDGKALGILELLKSKNPAIVSNI